MPGHRFALTVSFLAVTAIGGTAQSPPAPKAWPHLAADPLVTPVAGPGWLSRLGVTLDKTSLGRGTWTYGPTTPEATPPPASLSVRPSSLLTGEDIYRLNCLACHGRRGSGAPPEVKSAIDPIIGASLEAMRKQLALQHQPVGEAEARVAPGRIRQDILLRVHQGGQRMPPREYLRDPDLSRLYEYLRQLAGATVASRPEPERVTWARLGEQVVKGTCHICHDATGPWPTDAARIKGAIPSLQALMASRTVADFVTKASKGAPVHIASLTTDHRGRMPVFTNFKDEEIVAAYVYLATYPPAAN
jgi:mono/diheme cytochrome c family protein